MSSTDVSVEKLLFELGWSGVSPLTTLAEISLAFITAGLDTAAVVRRVDGVMVGAVGVGKSSVTDDCVRVIGVFLDEALRSGRLECLRRPGTRDTVDVLDALARLRGDGGE